MKYILYARKSSESEEKQVMSLDAQESEMMRIAVRDGLEIVQVIRESHSAKQTGMRPQFNMMLDEISKGNADAILTWAPDRISRNAGDLGRVVDLMDAGKVQVIQTYTQLFKNDPNSKFMLMMLCSQAKLENDQKSLNVKRGNRLKLERGDWPGPAPFGYVNNKATKTIDVDERHAPYLRQMFELYSTGLYSYQDIQDKLYDQGLRTNKGNKVYKSIIQRIIHKSFYYGIMESNGKTYVGNHTPLVTKELFEKCQRVAGISARPRKKTKGFTLSGFMTCEDCGCAITAEIKKEKYIYYHCTNGKGGCEQKRINTREEELQKQLLSKFSDIHITAELTEIIYQAKLEELHAEGYTEHVEDVFTQELELLSKRRSRLVDTYTAGDISEPLYKEKLALLSSQEIELKNQEKNRPKQTDPFTTIELIKNAFLSASSLASRYSEADNSAKRIILSESLSNCELKNQHLANFSYKSPYERLAKAPKNADFSFMLPD